MTVEPQSWKIGPNSCPPMTRQTHSFTPEIGECGRCGGHRLMDGRWMVPDTRLDAIADAWKRYKEAVEESSDAYNILDTWERFEAEIDALTEENNDGR